MIRDLDQIGHDPAQVHAQRAEMIHELVMISAWPAQFCAS